MLPEPALVCRTASFWISCSAGIKILHSNVTAPQLTLQRWMATLTHQVIGLWYISKTAAVMSWACRFIFRFSAKNKTALSPNFTVWGFFCPFPNPPSECHYENPLLNHLSMSPWTCSSQASSFAPKDSVCAIACQLPTIDSGIQSPQQEHNPTKQKNLLPPLVPPLPYPTCPVRTFFHNIY